MKNNSNKKSTDTEDKTTKTASKPRASIAKTAKKKAAKKKAKDGTDRGRPVLLDIDPEIQSRIVAAVRGGNYIEVAAAYGGITKDTLYRWLKQGAKEKDGPYREFSDAIGLAMAEAEVADVAVVNRAAMGVRDGKGDFLILPDWKASAWRLERRNQSRWNSKIRIEKTDEPIDPKELSDEELLELLKDEIAS